MEIPGVSNNYFLKAAVNAVRKHRGLGELDAIDFLQLVKEKAKLLQMDQALLSRPVNEGFRAAKRNATKFSRWPCSNPSWPFSTRLIPDWTSTHCEPWPTASMPCTARSGPSCWSLTISVLLNYIVPNAVHVLVEGRIVRSGGRELALELEAKGYAEFERTARIRPAPAAR